MLGLFNQPQLSALSVWVKALSPSHFYPWYYWYANSCWVMTLHIQASVNERAEGHLNFKGATCVCVCVLWHECNPPTDIHTPPPTLKTKGRVCLFVSRTSSPENFSTFFLHQLIFRFFASNDGIFYCQDAASHRQQPGVPAYGQCGSKERLPHGGHGLLLHHVLHSGERI